MFKSYMLVFPQYSDIVISREKAYFIIYLYLKFSALSVGKPFASLFGATSLALITEFSPDELVHLSLEYLT